MLPNEATFLKTQIITNQRDSLFAYILKNNIVLDKYDSFGALSTDLKGKVSEELDYMMKLANDFNRLVAMTTTRYNLIVSQGENQDAIERWDTFSEDMSSRCAVDLKAVYEKLGIRNIKLRIFLTQVQEAFAAGDVDRVDELIITRECRLKGVNRAKTKRIGEYTKQSWIGSFMLDYRYSPAKRIIRDIMNAEVTSNV